MIRQREKLSCNGPAKASASPIGSFGTGIVF